MLMRSDIVMSMSTINASQRAALLVCQGIKLQVTWLFLICLALLALYKSVYPVCDILF